MSTGPGMHPGQLWAECVLDLRLDTPALKSFNLGEMSRPFGRAILNHTPPSDFMVSPVSCSSGARSSPGEIVNIAVCTEDRGSKRPRSSCIFSSPQLARLPTLPSALS